MLIVVDLVLEYNLYNLSDYIYNIYNDKWINC